MTKPKYITEKDFKNTSLKYDGLVILECINAFSWPLLIMEPVLYKLRKKVSIQFTLLRIEINKFSFVVENYHVLQETTFLLFYNGKFIERIDGIISLNAFAEIINRVHTNLKSN